MSKQNKGVNASRNINLLSCPFCGGKTHLHTGYQGMSFITCGQKDDGSDGCGAVVSFRPNLTGNSARSAFNQRAR